MSTTATPNKPANFTMPTPSAEHLATQKVANRLVELCSTGKNLDAIRELYADNARHTEVMDGPGCPRINEGKATLLKKADEFHKSATIHSASCGKALVNGDQFVCEMALDATFNSGPMAGQRFPMKETALYTVENGKITEAKFFYGGCGG